MFTYIVLKTKVKSLKNLIFLNHPFIYIYPTRRTKLSSLYSSSHEIEKVGFYLRCGPTHFTMCPVLWNVQYAFFLYPGLAYWDLIIPMERASCPLHFPMVSLGTPLAERNPSLLVRDDKRMKMCGKTLGASWWMESLGQEPLGPTAPRVLALGLPKILHSLWYTLSFSTHCPSAVYSAVQVC